MGSNYYERRGRFSDEAIVETYLKYESQNKAAEELGCSRETVARAVRRAGIQMTGRRLNNKGERGGGGSPRKITDQELIEESKIMTRWEIAERHNMCISNIDRKLHRLKIHCVPASQKAKRTSIGKGGKYCARIKAAGFGAKYDSEVTLKRLLRRQNGICQICGLPVDESDWNGLRMGKKYPTIDHIVPISLGGSHTWDNVQLAHMICNSTKWINAAEVS